MFLVSGYEKKMQTLICIRFISQDMKNRSQPVQATLRFVS